MLFVLRAERAPSCILREREEDGVERTYWLWAATSWVVAVRFADGTCACACDPSLTVRIDRADNLALVVVGQRPLAVTVPAPPWPTSWPRDGADGDPSARELQMSATGATSGVVAISPLGRLPSLYRPELSGDDAPLEDLCLPRADLGVETGVDGEQYRKVAGDK